MSASPSTVVCKIPGEVGEGELRHRYNVPVQVIAGPRKSLAKHSSIALPLPALPYPPLPSPPLPSLYLPSPILPSFPFPSPSSFPFPLLASLPFPFPSFPFRFPSPFSRLGGLGERLSSPSGSGQSPAAKRFLVLFELKILHLVSCCLDQVDH